MTLSASDSARLRYLAPRCVLNSGERKTIFLDQTKTTNLQIDTQRRGHNSTLLPCNLGLFSKTVPNHDWHNEEILTANEAQPLSYRAFDDRAMNDP